MHTASRLRSAAFLVGLLTVGICALYWWRFETAQDALREEALAQTERRASQLATVMAGQIELLLRGTDLALRQLREEYDPKDSRFQNTVNAIYHTLPQGSVLNLVISDAAGNLTYASHELAGPVNVADREYFQFHLQGKTDRLHISKPILGRVVKSWIILLSRPIYRQGRFAGVVAVSMSPDYLSRQLASLALSPHDVIVLLHTDGSYIARNHDLAKALGKKVLSDRPFLREHAPDTGVFTATGSLDGLMRTMAWQRLEDNGLILAVGLEHAHILKPLEQQLRKGRLQNAGILLLILVFGGGITILLLRLDRQQRELAANEQHYRSLFTAVAEGVILYNADGYLVTCNPAAERILGYSSDQLRGTHISNTAGWQALREDGTTFAPEDFPVSVTLATGRPLQNVIIGLAPPEGPLRWLSINSQPVRAEEQDRLVGVVSSFFDITERRQAEAQIHHLAHHDALTGLPNRLALQGRLEQAIATARRDGTQLAVMLIDLDRFKIVNDSLGHLVGDRLLIEVAHRLKGIGRDSDIVARLGGDEFVVVITDVTEPEVVTGIADKLISVLSRPIGVDVYELHTTPSVGISLYPDHGDDVDTLLRNADTAMYHAKAQGRNNRQLFNDRMSQQTANRLELENSLRGAHDRGEIFLHFQPQIDVASGRVVAMEALARWQHKERGLIPPETFIPIAEESGLIVPLGSWILNEACRVLRSWRDQGVTGVRVAVNLSAAQLRQDAFLDHVVRTLESHGLDSADLELEVTESLAMQSPADTIAILEELKRRGVGLAIDDFGTGYSTLSYLKLLPIQRLKLDRSFVQDIATDPGDAAICKATTTLAHDLGLTLVAEGVETEAQSRYMRELGCDLEQGFWHCVPLEADEALKFVLQHNHAPH